MKVSVVIPCYNERENLPHLLQVLESLETSQCEVEYVLVDNGSSDGTAEYFAQNLEGKPMRVVTVPVNQGYGYGVQRGILSCLESDFVGWMHADMQFDVHSLERMLWYLNSVNGSVNEKKMMLQASRIGRPALDRLFTWGQGVINTMMFGVKMKDVTATPVLYPTELFRTIANEYEAGIDVATFMDKQAPNDFSFDTYMHYQALKHGFREERFPAQFYERTHGQSSWNNGKLKSKLRQSKRIFNDCKKIKKHEKVL